jgi:hypothetical protein
MKEKDMRKLFFIIIFLEASCLANQELVSSLNQLKAQLQDLNDILKKAKPTLKIFEQLQVFSKELDNFLRNPTDELLEKIINSLLYELLFENLEQLDVSELKRLQELIANIFKKIEDSDQQLRKRHVDENIQENFHEMVFDFFKKEKDVVDQFITNALVESQKNPFEQALVNTHVKLEKFQHDPTLVTLGSLAHAITFDLKSLDAVDRLDVPKLFMSFNQLVKNVEITFSQPIHFFVIGRKQEKEILIKKYRKQIFDSLYKTQNEFRAYVKDRLEKSQKERYD